MAGWCLILAVVLYLGKGDNLIAGYNSASKEEREKVNVKRLRIVMGTAMSATAAASFLIGENGFSWFLYCGTVVAICIICLIFANTWAKKKYKIV